MVKLSRRVRRAVISLASIVTRATGGEQDWTGNLLPTVVERVRNGTFGEDLARGVCFLRSCVAVSCTKETGIPLGRARSTWENSNCEGASLSSDREEPRGPIDGDSTSRKHSDSVNSSVRIERRGGESVKKVGACSGEVTRNYGVACRREKSVPGV